MFKYKGTDNFDIGAGYGNYEYDFFAIGKEDDFFAISNEDDFWTLMNHYFEIYKRFNYFLDSYRKIEDNTGLSPAVKAQMKAHNANLCLTLLEDEFDDNNVSTRKMIVNKQKPDGIYAMYTFYFYRFTAVSAKDYLERGLAYAKSGLHNAAIRHFTNAICLDTSYGFAFFYRGASYLIVKEYDKAIEDITKAINFNPDESNFFTFRGLAYKEAGYYNKAKADFTKALELDPDNKVAKECLEEIEKGE